MAISRENTLIENILPYNLLIDESSVEIGEVSHENFPFKLASANEMIKSEDASSLRISAGDVNWIFDRKRAELHMLLTNLILFSTMEQNS